MDARDPEHDIGPGDVAAEGAKSAQENTDVARRDRDPLATLLHVQPLSFVTNQQLVDPPIHDTSVVAIGPCLPLRRHTRYVILMKIANKATQTVISALIKQAKTLPNELYKSLTWDRGKELADHRRFTVATNIDVYFCDPQSP